MVEPTYPPPPHRRLRVYTYDPSTQARLETASINETTLKVPWEDNLGPGPVGEYLEVVDYDPASECFYEPVDLNHPNVLARDGLTPSEGNPRFHQQMVYAVAMETIANFEKALGRKAMFGEYRTVVERARRGPEERSTEYESRPILKLRVYPHALREANAYYSPEKKALLFGYFPAALSDEDQPSENLPGGLVFTCLSHDVIAHETTHALLDGLHRYFSEDTNPDALAFHEAFADIVALFQHFSQPEALTHQIAKTRGDLRKENTLAELARQFGQAIGSHGALRNAIGRMVEGKFVPHEPKPGDYSSATEAHARGSVLVAALFDAFLSIYESRTEDLLRLATGGTGELPEGHIHPDLVNRLAREASKSASHILRMAIRALDYCPPVDLSFGDYLRALITGDVDLMPDDPMRYRVAVIEGFRRRGIYPRDVRTLAVDALRWRNTLAELPDDHGVCADDFNGLLRALDNRDLAPGEPGATPRQMQDTWRVSTDRAEIAAQSGRIQYLAWKWFRDTFAGTDRRKLGRGGYDWRAEKSVASLLGLALSPSSPGSVYRSDRDGLPSLQVHSVRYALRPRQDGSTIRDVVVEIIQRRRGYFSTTLQEQVDEGALPPPPDFVLRGGCTLLIDGESGYVRYAVVKDILSADRLERRRKYESGELDSRTGLAFDRVRGGTSREPFAMTHRGH